MDYSKELSVKGFCFRGYKDNATVAEKVKACGLDRIDLSGPQVNFKDSSQHEPAIQTYQDAGVKIVGIGAVQLSGEPDDEEFFMFCKKAGCRTITCAGEPETFFDALEKAQQWAEHYDMVIAIHNHGGKHWLGSSQMLKHVLSRCGERVGLCIDTAWAIQAGEDPLKWLDLFAGRIHAVHFKDFIFDRHGKHQDVIVGEGSLNLSAFVKGLEKIGFDGPAILEYEADIENPVPALTQCVSRMREVFSSL